MNPLEAALRVMLTNVEAAIAWQEWRARGSGGQQAGGPPDYWNVPLGALIRLRRDIMWGLRNAGIDPSDDGTSK